MIGYLLRRVGGALLVLFALSLVSLGIILERWWLFRTKQDRVRELSGALEATLSTGDFPAAISTLEKRTSVGAAVARGLEEFGRIDIVFANAGIDGALGAAAAHRTDSEDAQKGVRA